MHFEIVGEISDIESLPLELESEFYLSYENDTAQRWRKRKGVAKVLLSDGTVRDAEVHWFEAHGIGKKMMRIKRFLD